MAISSLASWHFGVISFPCGVHNGIRDLTIHNNRDYDPVFHFLLNFCSCSYDNSSVEGWTFLEARGTADRQRQTQIKRGKQTV